MNWINILDSCPRDDETVLVTYCFNNNMVPIFAYYDEEKDIFMSLGSLDICPLKITHWCPLPTFDEKGER